MNNEKRLMFAVALSILIIIGYQAYMRQFIPSSGITQDLGHSSIQPTEAGMSQQAVEHKFAQPIVALDANVDSKSENTLILESKHIQAVATDAGAAVKEIYMQGYQETAGQPVSLLCATTGNGLFLSADFDGADSLRQWDIIRSSHDSVLYRASNQQLSVEKEIILHKESYVVELKLDMQNMTTQWLVTQYSINNGCIEAPRGAMDSRYIGADILLDNKIYRQRPSSKTIDQGHTVTGNVRWAATRGRYFSFIMQPAQAMQGAFIRSSSRQDICTGLVSNSLSIPPNSSIQHRYLIYVGPNDRNTMIPFDPTTDQMIHYGMFHFIGRILLHGLHMFYRLTHNYGLAIMLLAFAISFIMMPLTRKSLHSMKEMQKIQPETELVRKQYSDNPQKMNKEIIELYKKHKINPVGGCLPMLLQMPIFFSLYQVLLRSVELKGAQFLWIKDLSLPDAAFALPHTLPIIGSHIHILPILMAIAMAVQQRLSQGGGAKMSDQQRLMAGIMPVMFGLIFYNMPSGLVLYWFTNTLFMLTIQELVLKSRMFAKNI
jgi:YidC/Oxa1 family membrane protein insertase